MPTFSPAAGTYTSAQNVTITCATSGVEIYYTTNSDAPTESSIKYSGAITISSTTTLKARAYKTGKTPSSVQNGLYTINIVPTTGTVTDIDGNVYKTIKIGNQWWMAENLKVTHYRNGHAITFITGNAEWVNTVNGAYCYYDNDSSYASTYGALYNKFAVNESHNIAPDGWHVPTDDEWKQLEMYLGMSQTQADSAGLRGTDEGGMMKETGTSYWDRPNEGATNSSDFTARPGGYRYGSYGAYFYGIGVNALYWSATDYMANYAYGRLLASDNSKVFRGYYYKQDGYSIRCVRD